MLQQLMQLTSKRYYNSTNQIKRIPRVKLANARVGKAIRSRDPGEFNEIQLNTRGPARAYEPFPFAVTEENRKELLNRVTSPLFDIPYEEQLSSKESFCKNALRYLAQQLYKSGTPIRLDVRRLPCYVNPIVRSNQITHYRNKDEFSIWKGIDRQTETVGYMVFPISKHGDTVCVEPDDCLTMREEPIKMVKLLNEFIRNQAKLKVCYNVGYEGGWRRFTIRTNVDKELMLSGILSPRTLKVKEVVEERENFREFMLKRSDESGLNLKSIYYQPCPHSRCTDEQVPFELLHGDKTITETIGSYKFAITPETYIHQSVEGAKLLYDTVKKTIQECFLSQSAGEKPFIIDLRCGVGALSIWLADMSSEVVGIDGNPAAIKAAENNAKMNNIEKATYINANIEFVLEKLLNKNAKHAENSIVVCDVPKTGLHANVTNVLRNNPNIRKIIYICPKADSPMVIDNLMDLCSKISEKSLPPFAPISATPVDAIPQTEVCSFVIVLERLPAQ